MNGSIRPLLFHHTEGFGERDRRKGHAVGAQLGGEIVEQSSSFPLVAEGLDQGGAVLIVEFALPLH